MSSYPWMKSLSFVSGVLVFALTPLATTAGDARHVVLVVFDGMRPDFVKSETAPTLQRLAEDGVFFENHHPVYLSSTEVNGTALATGFYPSHSGVIANIEYRPRINPLLPIAIESPANIRRGDTLSGGHYLAVATVSEILHAQGRTTAIAGSKQVALLHDRAERPDDARSAMLFEGMSLPPRVAAAAVTQQGAFPPATADSKRERDDWTTTALLENLWANGVPDFTVLWLAEPDYAQHATGPGSDVALAAIRNSDANLGRVLAVLDKRGVRAETDVLVVSDHGFSTVERSVDIVAGLRAAGFTAMRALTATPAPGTVLVISNGNTCCLYVVDHDAAIVQRLVDWLQQQECTGVIFTREARAGTFSLAQAHIDSPDAPDVVVSLRWRAEANAVGAPGISLTEGTSRKPGQGNHAGLCRFDQHNTLVAAGPDFRRGIRDPLPTGNVDVAPTILWLLGVTPPQPMDGRVLSEALTVAAPPLTHVDFRRLEADRAGDQSTWHQYLLTSEVNGVLYLDEGNGELRPKQ